MDSLLLLALFCCFLPSLARDAPKVYVALGDSYAAGFGAGIPLKPRVEDSCWRHTLSYPRQFRYNVADKTAVKFYDFSCGNADPNNKIIEQISDIPKDAELISFTWGAQYIHLPDAVYHCDEHFSDQCINALMDSERRLFGRSENSFVILLPKLVKMILAKAPNALLVMLGYPRFLGSPVKDCVIHQGSPDRWFQSLKDRLNRLPLSLNIAMLNVLDQNPDRVTLRSPDPAFSYHRYCDSDPFFHAWKQHPQPYHGWSGYGYFNPTERGQELYKNLLLDAWNSNWRKTKIKANRL